MVATPSTTIQPSALELYESGLSSERLWARDSHGRRYCLPISDWTSRSVPGDADLLSRCSGSTLDIGCGPGRLVASLARAGVDALGIDISQAAVVRARSLGARALRRNVFGPVPESGRWRCVLLADGNIGIGGDPIALLRRVREIIDPQGIVHLEVARPRTQTNVVELRLEDEHGRVSHTFPWAQVSIDDLKPLARATGLAETVRWQSAGRWFVSLRRNS